MENCWRCGSPNGLTNDGWCWMCTRTPDKDYHLKIERDKEKQRGNPKTYGTNYNHHSADLGIFALDLLARFCRG